MTKLWVTYAWTDNENDDVDFYIARLREQLDVYCDRRSLAAGRIIWEQLGEAIADPSKCDAWLGICSPEALASERWREELFYALDRALHARQFPLMFLVMGEKPANLPPVAKIRLYVSTHENDWLDKLVAGARGEPAPWTPKEVSPLKVRAYDMGNGTLSFELTLREGTWPTWWVAEPGGAPKIGSVRACVPGTPRTFGMSSVSGPLAGDDGRSVWRVLHPPISPSMSAYVTVSSIPAELQLGKEGSGAFTIPGSTLRATRVERCP